MSISNYSEIGTKSSFEKESENDFTVTATAFGITRKLASCVNLETAVLLGCAMHYGTKNEKD